MRVNGVSFNGRVKPQPPTGVTFTNVGTNRPYNDGAISVSFTESPNQGKYPVSSYTTALVSGSASTATGGSSPLTLTNLSSAASLTPYIYATNTWGDSTNVTSGTAITVTTVPQAPTINSVTITYPTFSMAFTAGATGGSTITGYEYSTNGGTNWKALSGTTSPQAIATQSDNSAFVAGVTYAFILRAINANGNSTASAAVNGTYAGVPGLPGSVVAANTYSVGAISVYTKVTWTAAANNGSSITSYTVTASPGGASQTLNALTATFTALTPGIAYTFSVYATNAVGNGSPASSNSIYAIDIGYEQSGFGSSTTSTTYTNAQSMPGTAITNKGACVFLWRGLATGGNTTTSPITRFVSGSASSPTTLSQNVTEPQDITDKMPIGGAAYVASFSPADDFRIQFASESAGINTTVESTAILRYRIGTGSVASKRGTTLMITGAGTYEVAHSESIPGFGNYLVISSGSINTSASLASSGVRTSLQSFNTFTSQWATTSSWGEIIPVPVVDLSDYRPFFHVEKVNFPSIGSTRRVALELNSGSAGQNVTIRDATILMISLDNAGPHYYATPADFTTTSITAVTAGTGAFSLTNTGNLHLVIGSAAIGGNGTTLSSSAYLEQAGVGNIGGTVFIEPNIATEELSICTFGVVQGTTGTFNWKLLSETIGQTSKLINQRIFLLDLGIPNAELF